MRLTSFEFEGPFPDPDAVQELGGVYVVLSLRPGSAPVVLDVGETGYNVARGGQGLRSRLLAHDLRPYWERHRGGGTLAFAVLYEADAQIRLRIERALRWDHRPPCGTDPWHLGRPGKER